MRLCWDSYFMALAKLAAARSGCNSRPTGAVIVKDKRVVATGYNGSLPGQPQCTDNDDSYCRRRLVLPDDIGKPKYQECVSIHAEQNAINQVAKHGGISLVGSTMYCTLEPCKTCFDNICSVGIVEVVYEYPYSSNDPNRDRFWKELREDKSVKIRQFRLSFEDMEVIQKILCFPTSARRL